MNFLKIENLVLFLTVALLSGCGYPPLAKDVPVPTDYTYKIGPGDTLNIFVWGNPDISTNAVVRPDGKITIPLVEDLPASGKYPAELARVIENELGKYVRDPQVVIMVAGFQGVYSQQIRVIGQLSGGGSGGGAGGAGGGISGGGSGGGLSGGGGARFTARALPYKKDMTLLDLMISLGGIGQFADGNRASIVRNINGKNIQFGIKIDNLINNGDLSANVTILPGDIVLIPEAFY